MTMATSPPSAITGKAFGVHDRECRSAGGYLLYGHVVDKPLIPSSRRGGAESHADAVGHTGEHDGAHTVNSAAGLVCLGIEFYGTAIMSYNGAAFGTTQVHE